jgi:hypothetical protein
LAMKKRLLNERPKLRRKIMRGGKRSTWGC